MILEQSRALYYSETTILTWMISFQVRLVRLLAINSIYRNFSHLVKMSILIKKYICLILSMTALKINQVIPFANCWRKEQGFHHFGGYSRRTFHCTSPRPLVPPPQSASITPHLVLCSSRSRLPDTSANAGDRHRPHPSRPQHRDPFPTHSG